MISDQEGPRVLDFTGGGELSGWVRVAESLTTRDVPALLTAPDGTIVRATEKAAKLAGEASPAALVGLRSADVLVEDGPMHWLRGRVAVRLVRLVSWPHVEDDRITVTALVDVSDLVTGSDRDAEHERAPMSDERSFRRVDRDYPLQAAQREARIGTWEWDVNADVLHLSDMLIELTGIADGGSLGFEQFLERVHPDDRERLKTASTRLLEQHEPLELELRWMLDDQERTFRLHGTRIAGSGGAPLLAGTVQDVTEQRGTAGVRQGRPGYDDLTGLVNRAGTHILLSQLLDVELPASHVAVLCCNIDNFKRIINSVGHDAADELLAVLAGRLAEGLPEECTAARLSGEDEFVIICSDLSAVGGLDSLITRIAGLLRTTVPTSGYLIHVSSSIGVAIPHGTESEPADLLRFANAARVMARRRGVGQVAFANPALIRSANWQLRLEGEMREAMRNDSLSLLYQPVVRSDGSITGAEALVRWPHPEHGLLSPGQFLPVAEEGGLLRELDIWVLSTALREATGWESPNGQLVEVGVNLAGLVPSAHDFTDVVAEAVREAGIEWDRLMLELVETELHDLATSTRRTMEDMLRRGARFAVDDFGTGYSSLARLAGLPVRYLKIAREFVASIEEDPASFAVVRAIVDLASSMGKLCIAEGVETTAQLRSLTELGVELHQGWLFSPPVPADELRQLLVRRNAAASAAPSDRGSTSSEC